MYAARCLCLLSTACLVAPVAPITQGPPLKKVEIDWEIVVDNANDKSGSPQISLYMAGMPDFNADHAEFQINAHNATVTGGCRATVSWGNSYGSLGTSSFSPGSLWEPQDTVTATTSLEVTGANTVYAVTALNSKSFGSVSATRLPSVKTSILGKIDFDLGLTMSESHIAFGQNRVVRLAIREVRYKRGGKTTRDRTYRVLYERPGTVTTNATPAEVSSHTAF